MGKLIWSAIALATINFISVNSGVLASTSKEISLPVTPQVNSDSWQEKFEQKRKEEEFLDDDTEKLLNRHKKWILLSSVVFVWMIYKSLWSSR
ncbi:MAG: hypothetical protein AB4368_16385 [Xenococcaceae cyanobacterium]